MDLSIGVDEVDGAFLLLLFSKSEFFHIEEEKERQNNSLARASISLSVSIDQDSSVGQRRRFVMEESRPTISEYR